MILSLLQETPLVRCVPGAFALGREAHPEASSVLADLVLQERTGGRAVVEDR